MNKTIILTGFMGAGKTCVGENLAKYLGLDFIDLDTWIEEKENIDIPSIFAIHGEARFRRLETEELQKVLDLKKPIILALGGGTPVAEENQEILLKSNCEIIYLKVSLSELCDRLIDDDSLPLLKGREGQKRIEWIETLLEKREPIYQKVASIVLPTDERDADLVAKKILAILEGEI